MKKFLSLVLALVMTMSLVTVSAGAKDFTDDETITYGEAVNVMSEVGVIDGYPDGSFQPTTNLTRGAAAKIICNLILGPTTAAALGADTAPYSDVPTTNVFAGYIAYCQKEGIISGYADGTFKPSAPLTGYAFMKMLLGALGYESDREGYTGANWSVNVAKQAIAIGLNKGNDDFSGQAYVNREEAMLYAFNTLNATMVEYEQNTSIVVNGDTQVTVQTPAKDKAWGTGTLNDGNIDPDGFVQFAEEYFPKLKLNNTTDAFGRPAREWMYDGEKIGTYVKSDLLVAEYTTEVTGKDLYDLLGKTTLDKYTTHVYVDGETEKDILSDAYFTAGNLVRTNTEKVGETGNGVLTQVYRDSANEEITIAIINTYVAVADEDYDTKNEDVELTVWGIDDAGKNEYVKHTSSEDDYKFNFVVSAEDFDVEDVEEDDIFLVTVAEGAIQTIADPEVIGETEITAFKQNSSLTTGGTKYSYADTACYDGAALGVYTSEDGKTINLKDTTYNVILDAYGYVIGVEEIDPAENWLFVTGYDGNYSNLSNKTADVGVIFLDGTMKTVEVNVKKSSASLWDDSIENAVNNSSTPANNHAIINTWCSYTVNDEGVYTLKVAELQNAQDATGGVTIDKKHVSLDKKDSGKVYGNDDTVYLNVTPDVIKTDSDSTANIIDDVESVTVGVKNVNLEVKDLGDGSSAKDYNPEYEIYTLYKDNGYITAVVAIGDNQGVSSSYAYVTSSKVNQESYDKTEKEYTWTREVVINGEITEISYVGDTIDVINPSSSKDGTTDDRMDQGYWYKVSYYADGTVKSAEALKDSFTAADDEYIDTVADIENSFDNGNFDVGVLWDTTTVEKLTYKNGTLYTDTDATKGFSVSPEVKVVLCLAGKDGDGTGTDAFDDVDDSYTGYAGLEKALRNLNSNFSGELSAILEDGVATSIIINDLAANDSINTGSETPESASYKLAAEFDNGTLKFTVSTKENSDTTPSFDWKVTAQNTTSGFTYTAQEGSDALEAGSSSPSTKEVTTNVQIGSGIIFYTVTVEIGGDTLTATLMG